MARTIIVVTDECCCQDCPGECPAFCSTTTGCTVQYTVDTTAHGFDDTECSCAHGIFSIYKVCSAPDPATATSGDANCCWVSTGLVGPSNCKSEAALPTNHPCACCLSIFLSLFPHFLLSIISVVNVKPMWALTSASLGLVGTSYVIPSISSSASRCVTSL